MSFCHDFSPPWPVSPPSPTARRPGAPDEGVSGCCSRARRAPGFPAGSGRNGPAALRGRSPGPRGRTRPARRSRRGGRPVFPALDIGAADERFRDAGARHVEHPYVELPVPAPVRHHGAAPVFAELSGLKPANRFESMATHRPGFSGQRGHASRPSTSGPVRPLYIAWESAVKRQPLGRCFIAPPPRRARKAPAGELPAAGEAEGSDARCSPARTCPA